MGGIRLGGLAFILSCSPPFGLSRQSDNSFNVYRACVGDATGDATQITDFTGGPSGSQPDGIRNPRLSPDGTKILFQVLQTVGGNEQIWVTNSTPGSTATQLLSDGSDSFYHASWAPDSDTFVYVRGTGSGLPVGGTIYKDQVSAIGSPVTLRTAAAGFSVYRPQFNSDGTLVAYWYQQDIGTDELRVMNDDGTGDALVDTGVGNYDNNNPQTFGWARAMNTICYRSGNNAYVINSDATGKTQINTAGPAAGAVMRVTADCWPADDSHVVVSADLGNGWIDLIRAELDGSNTTRLNTSHGAISQSWMRGVYIYDSRIWFIEQADSVAGGMISSTLVNGTDYRVDLDVTDAAILDQIAGGDGFVWN